MRTLICDLRTGHFYAADGRWTPMRDEAFDFGSTEQASTFAARNRLHGVEVLLASDNPEQDRRVSVDWGPR